MDSILILHGKCDQVCSGGTEIAVLCISVVLQFIAISPKVAVHKLSRSWNILIQVSTHVNVQGCGQSQEARWMVYSAQW